MKSLLYQELRDLARRILDTPEQELSSLQGQARVLYEKLTVLRYTDGLLEELRETMEDQTPPPPVEESPAPEKPSVVSHESAPRENDAPQPVPESPQEVPVAPAEGLLAEEPVERDEETIVSAPKSPATVSTGGKSSSGKSRGKDYDEFQQSLFGEDFFTQELDFDPDEDLFEELPATAAAPPSPSFDPEGPLPEETSVAAPPSPSLDPEGPLPEETSVAASPSPSSDPEGPLPQAQETAEKPMEEPVKASFPDEEGEISASFFSFQVIREEEEEVSSDDEESLSASSVIEETEVECVPIGQDEVSSEQVGTAVQPEEAAEVQLGDDAIDMQPQEGPQSEAPVAPAEPEPSFQGEEPRPTINQIAAEKEQVRRPSLNEILARSNVRMDMNDRIAFINNLFDGDAEAFEAAVRYIFSLTDLDVANEYIIEILKPSYNNWFEKEKYERRFSEIVLHHFIEKEKRR